MNNNNIKIWIGLLDTRHWDFIATGNTENECRINMKKAWAVHCERCGIAENWHEFEDGLQCHEIKIGQVLRDGYIILGELI